MSNCIGYLRQNDPLYGYLSNYILSQLGYFIYSPVFNVYEIESSHSVYLYIEKYSGCKLIAKFYGNDYNVDDDIKEQRLNTEYYNLIALRNYGFNKNPFNVVKPLGKNSSLNYVLIEEFCEGDTLMDFIKRVVSPDSDFSDTEELYNALSLTAHFLTGLHNNTLTDGLVDFQSAVVYSHNIINNLYHNKLLTNSEYEEFNSCIIKWALNSCMYEDNEVFVHGDATPTNFILNNNNITLIDAERMKPMDRMFDVSRITGELKHIFMQYTDNSNLAEPFIEHFLWEYCRNFPDQYKAYISTTKRNPFYMAVTELRIARNVWIPQWQRQKLITEARKCLQ